MLGLVDVGRLVLRLGVRLLCVAVLLPPVLTPPLLALSISCEVRVCMEGVGPEATRT
jgi:hypothetical protein